MRGVKERQNQEEPRLLAWIPGSSGMEDQEGPDLGEGGMLLQVSGSEEVMAGSSGHVRLEQRRATSMESHQDILVIVTVDMSQMAQGGAGRRSKREDCLRQNPGDPSP